MNSIAEQPMKNRLGQGNEVDCARPLVFHREYRPPKSVIELHPELLFARECEPEGGR